MKVDNKTFINAIDDMNKYYKGLPEDRKILTIPEFEEKEFSLPKQANTNANLKKYLCEKRGIDEILINKLLQEKSPNLFTCTILHNKNTVPSHILIDSFLLK